jgi:TolA-binding protein
MLTPILLLAATMAQDVPPTAPPAIEPVSPSAPAVSEPQTTTAAPVRASDSSTAEAAIAAGLAAYKHRKLAEAEADFQKALDADPNSAAAAYYLGYTIYKRVEKRPFHPDKARAAKYFDQAFTLDPAFRPNWGRR